MMLLIQQVKFSNQCWLPSRDNKESLIWASHIQAFLGWLEVPAAEVLPGVSSLSAETIDVQDPPGNFVMFPYFQVVPFK